MSDLRLALQDALATMAPSMATVWQNTAFKPVAGTPYQLASLMPGTPINDEYGRNYADQGIFQVSLHYPPGTGPTEAEARAEAIRTKFYRGASFTKNGTVVTIMKTPNILPAMSDDDGRYVVPVSIEYRTSNQT